MSKDHFPQLLRFLTENEESSSNVFSTHVARRGPDPCCTKANASINGGDGIFAAAVREREVVLLYHLCFASPMCVRVCVRVKTFSELLPPLSLECFLPLLDFDR